MIIDDNNTLGCYKAQIPGLMSVLNFMQVNDLRTIQSGRYPISGTGDYVNIDVYETVSDKQLEAHRAYVDVQMLIEGVEQIGWATLSSVQPATEYDEDRDIQFFAGETQKWIAAPGLFFVFFPQDVHQPCLHYKGVHKIKKAVFKLRNGDL